MFFFLNCLHKKSNAIDFSEIIFDSSIKLILVMNNYVKLVGGNRFTITEDLTEMTEMVESRTDDIKKSFADIHFFYKV